MTTATPKAKVPARLVERMTKFYGTIEAARDAYKIARKEVRGADTLRYGGMVLWVNNVGQIIPTYASEVLYKGSADAYDVIPS